MKQRSYILITLFLYVLLFLNTSNIYSEENDSSIYKRISSFIGPRSYPYDTIPIDAYK
jgi:hypothetical protein